MAKLILNGSTSGSVTLESPAVSGTTTLTLPTTTDTLVGKTTTDTLTNKTLTSPIITGATITVASTAAPAFSAYRSTSQSISSATFTKVQCQTEEFDTNSNYDNATNYRFTPTVAGYYQLNGSISTEDSGGTITRFMTVFYKNGSAFKRGVDVQVAAGIGYQSIISALIYFNGTTDYVELYAYITGSSPAIRGDLVNTYFQASMVRSA